jgi:hypothetical protein
MDRLTGTKMGRAGQSTTATAACTNDSGRTHLANPTSSTRWGAREPRGSRRAAETVRHRRASKSKSSRRGLWRKCHSHLTMLMVCKGNSGRSGRRMGTCRARVRRHGRQVRRVAARNHSHGRGDVEHLPGVWGWVGTCRHVRVGLHVRRARAGQGVGARCSYWSKRVEQNDVFESAWITSIMHLHSHCQTVVARYRCFEMVLVTAADKHLESNRGKILTHNAHGVRYERWRLGHFRLDIPLYRSSWKRLNIHDPIVEWYPQRDWRVSGGVIGDAEESVRRTRSQMENTDHTNANPSHKCMHIDTYTYLYQRGKDMHKGYWRNRDTIFSIDGQVTDEATEQITQVSRGWKPGLRSWEECRGRGKTGVRHFFI